MTRQAGHDRGSGRRRRGPRSTETRAGLGTVARGALLLIVAWGAGCGITRAYAGETPLIQGVQAEPIARVQRQSLYLDPPTFCCPGPPVFGFDGEFYLSDRRRRFTLRPSAYTQLRWTFNRRTNPPTGTDRDASDIEFARTRLRVQGDLTRRFDYDVRANIDDAGNADFLVGSLQWHPGKGWAVKAGQMFLAVQREDWTVAEDTLTTEYSANDAVFAPGIGVGLQVHWQGARDRAWLAFSDGMLAGGNHLVGQTRDSEWAFTGRYEHQLLTTDWSVWDDLVGRRGRTKGILLGLGGGVAQGDGDADYDLSLLVTADLSLNWNGGQALLFGNYRHSDDPDGSVADRWGFVAQAGHFITCTSQIYGRYEVVVPGKVPPDLATYQSVTAGFNYFPFRWTNRLKLSAEFSYLFAPLGETIVPATDALGFTDGTDDQFYVRLQCQFGF